MNYCCFIILHQGARLSSICGHSVSARPSSSSGLMDIEGDVERPHDATSASNLLDSTVLTATTATTAAEAEWEEGEGEEPGRTPQTGEWVSVTTRVADNSRSGGCLIFIFTRLRFPYFHYLSNYDLYLSDNKVIFVIILHKTPQINRLIERPNSIRFRTLTGDDQKKYHLPQVPVGRDGP